MAKRNQPAVVVAQKENEPEVPAEVLAQAIAEVAEGFRKAMQSRLKYDTIVTLIHAKSKVGRRDIELVLNNLARLEELWLKPKVK
jgi:hypothetical protein